MHQKILSTLIKIYLKPFDDIQLHRDMIGYVCKISSGKTKFILKLFRSNHTDQALQSIKVMKYLYEEGYPTPNIIPTASGEPYFDFADQEEKRIGVLYEYIEGAEPDKDKDIEDLGRQTGRLHSLMQQYPADLYYHTKPFFIDRYINLLYKMNYPKVDQFIEYGNELWKRVEGLPQGFCHGDYHTGNMLKDTKGRYVLFDFDAARMHFHYLI